MGKQGWINCTDGSVPEIVLVEDDPQIRGVWLTVAMRLKIKFGTYAEPSEFLKDIYLFVNRTQFYVDQDFGENRGLGIELAKRIKTVYQEAEVYLVTTYPRTHFTKYLQNKAIDDVFSKYPWPFTLRNALECSEEDT